MAKAQEGAPEVDVDHAIEVRRIDLGQRALHRSLPRVVERGVEPAIRLDRPRHEAIDRIRFRHVGRYRSRATPARGEAIGQVHEGVLSASGEDHGGACPRERLGGDGADAPAGAGDESDLPLEQAAEIGSSFD